MSDDMSNDELEQLVARGIRQEIGAAAVIAGILDQEVILPLGGGADGSAEAFSPLLVTSDGIDYVVVFTSTRLAREQTSIAPYFTPMHFTDVVRRVGADCGLIVRAPVGGFTIAPKTLNLIRENT